MRFSTNVNWDTQLGRPGPLMWGGGQFGFSKLSLNWGGGQCGFQKVVPVPVPNNIADTGHPPRK
jgi:hypothetical protein